MFVKRIIHYINGTLDYSLWYPYDSSLLIVGYFDVYWVENIEDRKKQYLVFVFIFIDDCLMAWFSKKQNSISLSTTKAKYIVVGNCCMQLLWMKQMLKDYGIEQGTMNVTTLVL